MSALTTGRRRMAALLALAAIASYLCVDVSVANAASAVAGPTIATATFADSAPSGAAVAQEPTKGNGDGRRSRILPSATIFPNASFDPQVCNLGYNFCLWQYYPFQGDTLIAGGDFLPCEGFRFEGTSLQNHTWSVRNNTTGPFSIWDRFHDGSYNYQKYGWLPSGFEHGNGIPFSYVMDAFVYDPNNNCTSLTLHLVPKP